MKVNAYLSFNGQCEAAFNYYQQVLGGEIVAMSRYGESPMADQCSAETRNHVMHARLIVDGNVIMGSDNPPEYFQAAQGMHITISVDDPAEADRIYGALAVDGDEKMPIQETFWATRFGMVVDKFGTPWMINCEKPV